MFVLCRKGKGLTEYATRPGSLRSYTKDLTKARIFRTYQKANSEACGNEVVTPLESLLETPEG